MKRILFDIYHLPQFNFFKKAILEFDPDEVDIYCVDRGKLHDVIRYELPDYRITCIGSYKHNKGRWSMLFRIILPRLFELMKRVDRKRYSFVITAHYQANVVARLKGIPNVSLIDDPRKIMFPILKWAADSVYLPPFQQSYKGVKVFNALKEWAYLSPKYFKLKQDEIKNYGLTEKGYIFIREVSTKTSNYLSQQEDIVLSISREIPKDWKVVLSLEKKQNRTKYPSHWIILEEPVSCIHSIMFLSRLVISSGDSMAREGAMLGVPSIYAGNRDMPANDILIEMGMLSKIEPENLVIEAKKLMTNSNAVKQEEFRSRLEREWDDVTALILSKLRRTYKTP